MYCVTFNLVRCVCVCGGGAGGGGGGDRKGMHGF